MGSPGALAIQVMVPKDAATGNNYLYVSANAAKGSASYSDGQESNVPAVHIENSQTLTPPGVKITPLP
jgi:hypothetical protein